MDSISKKIRLLFKGLEGTFKIPYRDVVPTYSCVATKLLYATGLYVQKKTRPASAILLGALQDFTSPIFRASSFFNNSQDLTLSNLSWQFQTYHLALVVLVIGVVGLVSFQQSSLKSNLTQPNQREKAELAAQIDHFTPGIQEDATSLYIALTSKQSGFLQTPLLAETVETPVEVKKTERGAIQYTVAPGDTISSIGWKFGLKLTTLKYSNNLENVDSIKPGQVLTLPPEDLSSSYIAQIEAKKQAELAKKQRAQRLAQAPRRSVTVRERASEGFDSKPEGVTNPVNYNYISRGVSRGHSGIDMIAPTGTPVRAAKSGRVIEVSRGWSGGYGIQVVVDHGGGVKTRYAHLSGTAVSAGQTVDQGQLVGYVGVTGRTTGSHLHFEYLSGGRPINPF